MQRELTLDKTQYTICKNPLGEAVPGLSPAQRLSRAELMLAQNRAEACAKEVRLILDRDPAHLGAMELLAKALWQTGNYDALLRVIDRLINLNPYEPGYHALRGAALQAQGKYGEASRAMARAPESAPALAGLQDWQAGLIADRIQGDPVFRAEYARDPEAACSAYGFALVATPAPEGFISKRSVVLSALTARPS